MQLSTPSVRTGSGRVLNKLISQVRHSCYDCHYRLRPLPVVPATFGNSMKLVKLCWVVTGEKAETLVAEQQRETRRAERAKQAAERLVVQRDHKIISLTANSEQAAQSHAIFRCCLSSCGVGLLAGAICCPLRLPAQHCIQTTS